MENATQIYQKALFNLKVLFVQIALDFLQNMLYNHTNWRKYDIFIG